MSDGMDIECASHGKHPWKYDVICTHCGARWQCRSEDEPRHAPDVCTCGKRLMPLSGNGKGAFTAAALCSTCAQKPGEA